MQLLGSHRREEAQEHCGGLPHPHGQSVRVHGSFSSAVTQGS